VWRFGDVMVASTMVALRGAGAGVAGLAGISAAVAVGAGVVGWNLTRWVQRGGADEAARDARA